jgi:hypothetical protein
MFGRSWSLLAPRGERAGSSKCRSCCVSLFSFNREEIAASSGSSISEILTKCRFLPISFGMVRLSRPQTPRFVVAAGYETSGFVGLQGIRPISLSRFSCTGESVYSADSVPFPTPLKTPSRSNSRVQPNHSIPSGSYF